MFFFFFSPGVNFKEVTSRFIALLLWLLLISLIDMCLGKCYFLKGYAFLKLSHYHCLLRRKSQSEFLKFMVPSTSNLNAQESSAVIV